MDERDDRDTLSDDEIVTEPLSPTAMLEDEGDTDSTDTDADDVDTDDQDADADDA